jgi:hypothetical protein
MTDTDAKIGEVINVKLAGADQELYQAGIAEGMAQGLVTAADTVGAALEAWTKQASDQEGVDEAEAERRLGYVQQFVASWTPVLDQLRQEANTHRTTSRQRIGRAVELGAGKPRARTLRERMGDAMMGALQGWKG